MAIRGSRTQCMQTGLPYLFRAPRNSSKGRIKVIDFMLSRFMLARL